jgi:hypothetical protein
MKNDKSLAVKLISEKLSGKSFLTYNEIGEITGYHPKYVLKLKRELLDGTLRMEHGNKNRKPVNILPKEEEEKIVNLYKKSNVSIRKFCKFYNSRSYSCIYNVLKKNGLI